ncbi:MAG: RNA polymerase sigma factor [Planctomycetes bacterium]|nr:RNA polymerase sigma factor [Planctomycetota bacterium]
MDDETLLDDETLIGQMAVGNPVAVAEFYDRWYPQFARLATRLTGDGHAGEDLDQDAAIRVIVSARLYKKGRSARSWLLAVVYNAAHDWWRKKKVREAVSLDEPVGADEGAPRAAEIAGREPTAAERADARERADAVTASLKKLTPAERAVILLRDYEGLSAPEAADVLGISVEKVGSRLFRARKRLGGLLQADWPGLFPSHEL